ncbi:hypothetical protein [Candidatus Marinarcus aquaticus]|uniref:Intracellular septation protein A n=1 Tax=Candidatus Marinarcus aquaticus TaxID=2044504 RepID=A0A4Q0XTZ8_9BACT|nr:hypothetical protein [Candidatus Marinarcus aquaticus]RXJ57871.1 hypothetical protein CRV04_05025 [Candidatus Marinarcus aquaticus]
MNTLLAIVYAPLVFYALKTFDIKMVSVAIMIASLLWTLALIKKGFKAILYPLLYLIVGLMTFLLDDFMVLKILPLLITAFITAVITLSYIKKESIILHFVKRFSKKEFNEQQEVYIERSTLFWVMVSLLNLGLHLYAYLSVDINFWVFYSSIGGYALLLLAGLFQFLHKTFIFDKRVNG